MSAETLAEAVAPALDFGTYPSRAPGESQKEGPFASETVRLSALLAGCMFILFGVLILGSAVFPSRRSNAITPDTNRKRVGVGAVVSVTRTRASGSWARELRSPDELPR